MRSLFVVCYALATCSVYAQSLSERAAKDEIFSMQSEEPAMRKAFQKASESLDQFLLKAKADSPDHTGFALKVAIRQGGNIEYFWVNKFASTNANSFEGEIANEPRRVKSVKMGERYSFGRNQIVDWIYIDKVQKQMVGNFTLCALLTKESAQEAEAMKKRFKLDCTWLQ